MALARQATKIIIALAGDETAGQTRLEYHLTLQNKDISIEPEFYGGSSYDETIGAKRISNLRGFRVTINLSYNLSKESLTKYEKEDGTTLSTTTSTFRDMFNEIMSCFKDGNFTLNSTDETFLSMYVYVANSSGSYTAIQDSGGSFYKFIPSDMSYTQTYTNQIGRFIPSITLVSERLLPEIGAELQGIV